jgi:hypothetical protein
MQGRAETVGVRRRMQKTAQLRDLLFVKHQNGWDLRVAWRWSIILCVCGPPGYGTAFCPEDGSRSLQNVGTCLPYHIPSRVMTPRSVAGIFFPEDGRSLRNVGTYLPYHIPPRVMAPCSVAGIFCPEDGSRSLRNVGTYLPHHIPPRVMTPRSVAGIFCPEDGSRSLRNVGTYLPYHTSHPTSGYGTVFCCRDLLPCTWK